MQRGDVSAKQILVWDEPLDPVLKLLPPVLRPKLGLERETNGLCMKKQSLTVPLVGRLGQILTVDCTITFSSSAGS